MGRLTAAAIAVVAVAAAVVVAVVLSRSSTHAAPSAAKQEAAAAPSVRVVRTKLGRILVDAKGHTLYLYVKDRGTKSACSPRCAQVWPPATVSGRPTAGPGVEAFLKSHPTVMYRMLQALARRLRNANRWRN